ncbi:MAG: amidohydrolase family protein [Phycisphaera sp.]|nr:amidohydrolase family protein [Phycisphaera sp.]
MTTPNQPEKSDIRQPVVYIAAAVRDAESVNCAPGAVALEAGRVIAAGEVNDVLNAVDQVSELPPRRVDLPDRLLIPGLVNAHAHLDLTDIGPQPFRGDFVDWVRMVMREKPRGDGETYGAVRRAAKLSVAAGVLTVGDIAGGPSATSALQRSRLRGVSYIEQFGIGIDFIPPEDDMVDQLQRWEDTVQTPRIRVGLQPHAPYSAGPDLYDFAADLNVKHHIPVSTHLAETPEELQFVADATGPFHDLLVEIGKWDPAFRGHYYEGLHPVHWLLRSDLLDRPPDQRPHWLLAHCNYVGDPHIDRLAQCRASVAYCPRASDYFRHRHHRYRDMLDAGVNVALGTDSIVCHGTMSILDEMRLLHQRDHTDPAVLLKMATTHGLRALELDPRDATFAPAAAPGVVAITVGHNTADPLRAALSSTKPPTIETLALP